MALTYSEVNSMTNVHIVPRTTDVIFRNDPLLQRMLNRNSIKFQGGTFIQRPIIYAKLNGDFFPRGGSFNTDYVLTDTALSAYMKYAYVNITLYGADDVLNRGPEAVFSQVETKMANASMRMAEILASNLYRDGSSTDADVVLSAGVLSNTNAFSGLLAWIDDGNSGGSYLTATNNTRSFASVGGTSRADLLAVPTSGTATPDANIGGLNAYTNRAFDTFQLSAIQTAFSRSWFGSDHVDLIVTTTGGYNQFWNSIQPMQRYQDQQSDVAKIGFMTFRFNGAEVVVSRYLSEGLMFGLNTNYLEMYVTDNPKFQFGFTGFKEAQNTVDVSGQFLFSGNLIAPNPRTSFKMVGSALN